MAKEKAGKGEIIIFQISGKGAGLEVRLEKDTVWLSQKQIADLFGTERSVITKHLRNVINDGELSEEGNVQKMHIAGSDKPVKLYGLDMILSVGYRVNSKRATRFRIWATEVLKKHIVKGYTVNESRLIESESNFRKLQATIEFLKRKAGTKMLEGQAREILDILAGYSKTLTILERYDSGKLQAAKSGKASFALDGEEARRIIAELKRELVGKKEAGDIFGNERGEAFRGIIGNLYQTFGRKELYPDFSAKASHLLYLVIKDHPFSDGNKRIASFLFVYFLDRNGRLFRKDGERKINDNALAALALLVAESDPKEKDQLIALITQLID